MRVSDLIPSESKFFDPKPLIISGLSIIFIELENICSLILSLRNEVPLAIAEDEIALAKVPSIPFAILLSNTTLNFSLPIFLDLIF